MPEPPAPPPAPDLAAIEARAAAAPPEPWAWFKMSDPKWGRSGLWVLSGEADGGEDLLHAVGAEYAAPRKAIRDFIAAARTDVPALVAYARALEAENAACWKLLKQMGEQMEQAVTMAERATVPPPPRVRELAAENARLRAGLAPLAALLTALPDEWPDGRPIYVRNDAQLTAGDIRAAHALLERS